MPEETQRGLPFFRGMRAAMIFLTRIPVGGFPYSRADWRWAAAHFPLVGGLLGAVCGGLFVLLKPVGALPAGFLVLGASMMLTGAFHEDGLADTSDALGGAFDRQKLREILKDSRVGSFGASALVFSIGARAALLAQLAALEASHVIVSLAWVGCLARAVPVWQMVLLPYATEQGAKSRDVTRARPLHATVATAYALALLAGMVQLSIFTPARAVAALVTASLVGFVTAYRYYVRLGGLAGDFLGATEQLVEIGLLCVLAWGHA